MCYELGQPVGKGENRTAISVHFLRPNSGVAVSMAGGYFPPFFY